MGGGGINLLAKGGWAVMSSRAEDSDGLRVVCLRSGTRRLQHARRPHDSSHVCLAYRRPAACGGAARSSGGGQPQPVVSTSQVGQRACTRPRVNMLAVQHCWPQGSTVYVRASGMIGPQPHSLAIPRCRRVLPEPAPVPVPPEAAAGLAWHPRALYAKYDAWQLARRAKRLFQSIAPQVGWAAVQGWFEVVQTVALWQAGLKARRVHPTRVAPRCDCCAQPPHDSSLLSPPSPCPRPAALRATRWS